MIIKEKNRTVIYTFIFIALSFISIFSVISSSIMQEKYNNISSTLDKMIDEKYISVMKNNDFTSRLHQAASEDGAIYVLIGYEDKIAVYDCAKGQITEILDVYLISLPNKDKEYLFNGITVKSINELNSLIQDYTS